MLHQLDIKLDEALINVRVDVCQLSKEIMGIQIPTMVQGGRDGVPLSPVNQRENSPS